MGLQGITGSGFGLNTYYQQHRANLERSVARLASGDKMANAGDANAAEMSISERFRNRIRSADASTTSIQTAQAFLQTTEAYGQTTTEILQRMMELSSRSSDGLMSAADRAGLQDEFQALQHEITDMTRQSTFFGKQTVGREGMLTYDANSKKMQFWQTTGEEPGAIERDFSTGALDAAQNLIGFDSTESFTMSDDGKSVFFMGSVAGDGAGVVRAKRYDIDSHTVSYGDDLYATGDTLYVDEEGQLWSNGTGTAYRIDRTSLDSTATLVTDIRAGTEFSVYEGDVIYSRTADNAIASTNPDTSTQTLLTGPLAFAAGTDHTISGSGRFVADESAPGTIRVINTRTGNSTTMAVGAATSVIDLQFNADGDRVYYINQATSAIHYAKVSLDDNDNVVLTDGGKAVQGINNSSFNGLSLGGSSNGSSIKYVVSQDTTSVLSYEAIDLSLYNLRLNNNRIDTQANADAAMVSIKTAQNRAAAQRAKVGAMASRFSYVLNAHLGYIGNARSIESQIRDVDVAAESTKFTTSQVQMQVAQSVLAQFNTLKSNVLRLLNG